MTGSRWTFPDKRQLWLAHTELARARTLGLGGRVIETLLGFVLIVTIESSPYKVYQDWSWSSTLRFPRDDACGGGGRGLLQQRQGEVVPERDGRVARAVRAA